MDALLGWFSTYGIGGLLGAVVGWILFGTFAAASCTPTGLYGGQICTDVLLGMTFIPFVVLVAALGGLVNLSIAFFRSNRD